MPLTADDYRAMAEECAREAKRQRDATLREQYEKLQREWQQLAYQVEVSQGRWRE